MADNIESSQPVDEKAEPYEKVDFGEPKQKEDLPPKSFGNDEIPIGQKTSVKFEEFPPEGYEPKRGNVKKVSKPIKKDFTHKQESDPQDKKLGGSEDHAVPKGNQEFPSERATQIASNEDLPIRQKATIDDMPIGGGTKFQISEYPEGQDGAEELQATVAPLAQRLKSKAWKLRLSAFEEMLIMFENGESLDEYYEEWPKLLNDNNPGSQEKALQAFSLFIKKAPRKSIETRLDGKESVRVLIDKCIAPGKKNIMKLAFDLLCDVFEKRDKQEMFEVLVELLKNKAQKVQSATIQSIIELLTTFGPKRLDYMKPFFGEIEKLAQSQFAAVKAECMNFYREAHKWLGEQVLAPFTKNLKKQQTEELEKFQKEYQPEPMVPKRGGEAVTVGAGGSGNNGVDAYDLVDAVDIFGKFNEKWCEKVAAQTKWNEKQVLLEQLIKEASCPKIAPGNYFPMLQLIKKLLDDSNQQINTCAIKICGLFVKGLRKNFTPNAKMLFPQLTLKLREKKTIMMEARQALELFHYSVIIEDLVDYFKEGLGDKNPQMRAQMLYLLQKFVSLRGFGQPPKQKFTDTMKTLLPLAKKMIEDSVPEVREAAVQCFGNIKPYLSDQLINTLYQDIAQQKLNKINEISNQILEERRQQELKEREAKKPKQQELVNQSSQQLQQSQLLQNTSKVQTNTKGNNQNEKKPPLGQKCNILISEEPELPQDQLENQLREVGLDDDFFTNINGNPKQKAESIKGLENYIDAMLYHLDLVLLYLKLKLKDWKEANLTINKELFAMLIYANNLDPKPFNQRSFQPLCKLLIEKSTESKFKEDISNLFRGCCEVINPKYVMLYLIFLAAPKEDKENNKVIPMPPQKVTEILLHLSRLIELVTLKYTPVKEVIDFGKEQLIQTNAGVKGASIELFKILFKFLGADLQPLIGEVPPPILKTLQMEFEKIPYVPGAEPQIKYVSEEQRELQKQQTQQIQQAQSKFQQLPQQNQIINQFNSSDNIPRIDLSQYIPNIVKKLADVQWNKRKEGIEELDKLITNSGSRISINGLGDVVSLLRQRLSDNNKQLIRPIVQIVGRLAEACGNNFKSQVKPLITPLVQLLSDKSMLVRQDVVATLEKLAIIIGNDQVIQQFAPFYAAESAELKQELFLYISKYPEALSKSDFKQLVVPLINCLCDRVKEVRQAAELVAEQAILEIGLDPFQMMMKDLKPAVVQSLAHFFAKFGLETEEPGSKRSNKTPKGKLTQTQLMERNMKRNQTTKELITELNNSQEFRQRTPNKSIHQKSHKTLPHEGTPLRIRMGFTENSLVASSVNLRDLKMARQNQENAVIRNIDQFPQGCLGDLAIYLREDLHQQLMHFNYKEVLRGMSRLMEACNETQNKQDLVEFCDLVLKYILIKIYGNNANKIVIEMALQLMDVYFKNISKAKYLLSDLEQHILITLIRELVYAEIKIPPDLIITCQLVYRSDSMVKKLFELFHLNHAMIHQFLSDQKERIDFQISQIIAQGQLAKHFTTEQIQQYAMLQINNKELIQELQNAFSDNVLRQYGLLAQPLTNLPLQSSPIVSQTTMSSNKAQNTPQAVDVRNQQFLGMLDQLLSQYTAQKIESLMHISDLLNQNTTQTQKLFVDNAEAICRCFHSILSNTFNQREHNPAQYTQFFLQALNKLFQLKTFINALPYDLLCGFTEEIMQRLLTEDEITKAQQESGDGTVKLLNSTILRILEHTSHDIMFSIAFDILTKFRRRANQSKMIGLLVKCIGRITSKLEQNPQSIKVDLLLLKFHHYLNEFSKYPNFAVDEQGVKTIKLVLQQLVKIKGEGIWESYHLIDRSQQDQYISKWIQAYLGNAAVQQQLNLSQQPQLNQSQLQNGQIGELSDQDAQMFELLLQPHTMENGIRLIAERARKDAGFQWQRFVPDDQLQLLIKQQIGGNDARINLQTGIQQVAFMPDYNQKQPYQFQQQNQLLSTTQPQSYHQSQNLKTPEYLMQKLNDMKNKVQVLVGTQTNGFQSQNQQTQKNK